MNRVRRPRSLHNGDRMKTALCLAFALALLHPDRVRAERPIDPATSSGAAAVVDRYVYHPDALYTVRTGLGLTTQIELSPDEAILDYSTGFSSGWDLVRRDNVFYLKPRDVDVDTNMTVRTRTHTYLFDLKVVAADWRRTDEARRAGVQYRIVFDYPADTRFGEVQQTLDEQAAPLLSTTLAKDRSYHFNYSYAARGGRSSRGLVPLHVWDDGRFTYLRLRRSADARTGEFPAVFGRDTAKGEDFVVNTTVEGDTVVVHGTYPYLAIRLGRAVVGVRRNPTP